MKKIASFFERNIKQVEVISIALLSAYFLFQSGFFISNVAPGMAPDAAFHSTQIQNVYHSPGLSFTTPPQHPQYEYLFQHSRISFIYHYMIGKALHIIPFKDNPFNILRYISLTISCLSLFVFYKTSRLFLENPWQRILAFAIQTNLLMFTYLGTLIHYDTPANLLALSSFYFFFKYIKEKRISSLMWALSLILLSSMTKNNNLPLIGFMGLSWIWINRREIRKVTNTKYLKKIKTALSKKKFALIFAIIISALFVTAYGRNVISYGSIRPSCIAIFTQEECREGNRVIRNGEIIAKHREQLIEESTSFKKADPIRLLFHWGNSITDRTLGLYLDANSNAIPSVGILFLCKLFFIISSIQLIRKFNNKDSLESSALFITLGYTTLFFFYIIYRIYHQNNALTDTAIEGRYLFALVPILVIINAKYFLSIFSKKYIPCAVAIAAAIFIYSAFPSYYTNCHRKIFEPELSDIEPFKSCTKKLPTEAVYIPN